MYNSLCIELPRACLHFSGFAALLGEQAAAACLQVADLAHHLIRTRFQDAAGRGPGRARAGSSAEQAARAVEFAADGVPAAGARIVENTVAEAVALLFYMPVLAGTLATPQNLLIAINAQRERQEQAAGGGDGAPQAPGRFARAILLDPQRRVQRLAATWLAYSLQGDLSAVADTGRRAEAQRRLGPRLATLLDALQLPAAPQNALRGDGVQLGAEDALQLLYDYLTSQKWCSEGAGLPLALPLPPAAYVPAARVLTGVLSVCRVGSKAERLAVASHACVVLQMLHNPEAVEAASPGWRASIADALFEACVGKGRAGGGAWGEQRAVTTLYVRLAEGGRAHATWLECVRPDGVRGPDALCDGADRALICKLRRYAASAKPHCCHSH